MSKLSGAVYAVGNLGLSIDPANPAAEFNMGNRVGLPGPEPLAPRCDDGSVV